MSTHQTINYQPATEYRRVAAAVTIEIRASPHKIFPLVCPVEELRWIPHWDYQLIYSKSGVNEINCIETQVSGVTENSVIFKQVVSGRDQTLVVADISNVFMNKADNRVVTVTELGEFWHDLQIAEIQGGP